MPNASKTIRRPTGQKSIRGLRPHPLHPWRHDNTGRLLLMGVINWQDVLVRGLQQRGFRGLRASHLNLLRHLDLVGTRITEIAERSRMSKQAVGQLVAICEAQKLVKTTSDSTDRRAKIVTFTDLGRAIIDTEREVMERIDAELKVVLGAKGFAELRRSLHLVAEWIGPFGAKTAPTARGKARA
jgi:DNA-binding MarR family transcriptional regulator